MQDIKSFEHEKTHVLILLLYLQILLAGKVNPLSNKMLGVVNIFQAEIEKKKKKNYLNLFVILLAN